LAFFERLRLRVAGIFLTEALVTLGAISCSEGSSAVAGGVEGAAVVAFGGSSSSLQEENKLCITQQKEGKYGAIAELEEKFTTPEDQSIQYLLQEQGLYQPPFSVERNSKKQIRRHASPSCPHQCLQRAQEEAMSLNWCLLLILRHHLRPDFLQPRGLQIQKRPDQPEEALPLEEEGAKRGIGVPAHSQVSKVTKAKKSTAQNKRNSTTSEQKQTDMYLG
jgi:hypothetical protein